MRETFEIGEIVTGIYKTGKYIGEVTNSRPGSYIVKVLAVLKHPVQGDLHNVKQADVPFFHERRALAFREQTNIPEQMVKKYEGEIPDYTDSLKLALETQMNSFAEDDSPFAVRSLETLEQLKRLQTLKTKRPNYILCNLVVTVCSLSLTLLKNQRVRLMLEVPVSLNTLYLFLLI